METILLVDASPLVYSNFDKIGHLSTSTGEPTGLRYGFMRSVRSYAERTSATKVVICFDTLGTPIKASNVPEYKLNRETTPTKQKMYNQVPALKEMIRLTWYSQAEAPGYEADDLIVGNILCASVVANRKRTPSIPSSKSWRRVFCAACESMCDSS